MNARTVLIRYVLVSLFACACVAAICIAAGAEPGKQDDYFQRVAGRK